MNRASTPPCPTCRATGADTATDDAGAERTARHLRMLAELAEIGMELARDVRRQAPGGAGPGGAPPEGVGAGARADRGLVFARIARAVRQTVALEARLAAEAHRQETVADAGRRAAERARGRQQKERVRRLVETAIAAEADGNDAEDLRLDLDERLEDPDIDAELGRRPIGAIVAGICADLGVAIDLRCFSDAELGFDLREPDAKPGGAPPCAGEASEAADTGGPPPSRPARAGTGRDPP